MGVYLDKFCPFHDIPDKRHGKQRLNAGGTSGDNRERACRRYGGDCRISQVYLPVVYTAGIIRENTPFHRKCGRCALAFPFDKPHDLLCKLQRAVGVVGNAQQNKQVSPSHDAEPDLPVRFGGLFYFLDRVLVDIDHIVKKMHGFPDGHLQFLIVKLAVRDHAG